jgi:hypothetical protein
VGPYKLFSKKSLAKKITFPRKVKSKSESQIIFTKKQEMINSVEERIKGNKMTQNTEQKPNNRKLMGIDTMVTVAGSALTGIALLKFGDQIGDSQISLNTYQVIGAGVLGWSIAYVSGYNNGRQ